MESKKDPQSASSKWKAVDFDEIEVGERISGGGVGEIHKGWYKGQAVALKTLFDPRINEELKKEYMDELIVMSKVNHSNIVKFLGASMVAPNLCFVMELCECSLSDLLHKHRIKSSKYDTLQMAVRRAQIYINLLR